LQKVKDLKSLEKFSKFYKDYKILNFDSGNMNKDDLENNTKLLLSSLKYLLPIIDEFDNTTPTTQITFQVITEGFVTKEEFTNVQLNLKKWQEVTKLIDASAQLQQMISMLTGSH
jgi:hypothetical protein